MFVAEFENQRDRDRIWQGSPWHVSKNAVILSEFDECMRPSELRFDKMQMWARVVNLPFNLHDEKWSKAIAKQIDQHATMLQFDQEAGYLRARVTIEVEKPLRRWILIDQRGESVWTHMIRAIFRMGRVCVRRRIERKEHRVRTLREIKVVRKVEKQKLAILPRLQMEVLRLHPQ